MAHPQSHINKIEATRNTPPIDGGDTEYWKDAYACPGSAQAALIAAGTTIDLVLRIVDDGEDINNDHDRRFDEKSGDQSSSHSRMYNKAMGEMDNDGGNAIKSQSLSSSSLSSTTTTPTTKPNVKAPRRRSNNSVALVRPPGHHAETNVCMGFCYYNNAALAAYAALNRKNSQTGLNPISRVLIVDWDVHHGNGTQQIFEDDPRVLYISLHRYPFYPNTGRYSEVGKGAGEGFTVNIGWSEGGVGDVEYLAAFRQIIMPVAASFNPQLVLISAGFDAAAGDPLGGCSLTPIGYAHMTHQLMQLANGKVMLILEGGYNLRSVASSAEACIRVMLGESPPPLPEKGVSLLAYCIHTHTFMQNSFFFFCK
jgi:acetoin utilization deacetylase AcuC-like enzyme